MDYDAVIKRLSELLEDLGFEQSRMSLSGELTYNEICSTMASIKDGNEHSQELAKLIEDLGFDYDRMSQAGQAAYEMICYYVVQLTQ